MSAPLTPPFRAEHIGSLLRPPELLAIRADKKALKISDEEVRHAENEAIKQVIDLQIDLGLLSITDGEFRRHAYSDSFTVDVFSGVKIGATSDQNWIYSDIQGQKTSARVPIVIDKLEWLGPTNVENYKFVSKHCREGIPKVTLPGPCYIHFRSGRKNISQEIYPNLDLFWNDIVEAYIHEIKALYDVGCRYLQLDETSIAKLGDPKIREGLAERGDEWEDLLKVYIDVINEIVRGSPKDLAIGVHLCRGNKGGSWQASTGYDDVAVKLFRELNVQFYFLEYDSPRAGSFEPLREVPENKTIILGLVSTKNSTLETFDYLRKRIEAAAKFIDIEKVGVSPQCGFASLDTGNPISYEGQVSKIKLVIDFAQEIWGNSISINA